MLREYEVMNMGNEIAGYFLGRDESSEAGKKFPCGDLKRLPPLRFKKGGWVGRLK